MLEIRNNEPIQVKREYTKNDLVKYSKSNKGVDEYFYGIVTEQIDPDFIRVFVLFSKSEAYPEHSLQGMNVNVMKLAPEGESITFKNVR